MKKHMQKQSPRNLIICNSVYQILVALWLKHTRLRNEYVDLIVSDHMNNGTMLAERLEQCGLFEHVYYAQTLDFAKFKIHLSRASRIGINIAPQRALSTFVNLSSDYSSLYVANVDYFAQLAFHALSRRNKEIQLLIFEDGLFTYSGLYEKDYINTAIPVTSIPKQLLHSFLYHTRTIYGNVAKLLLFHPEDLMWKPDFPVEALEKINSADVMFRDICNYVFSYKECPDCYDRKYIFLEESFYAEGAAINDCEVIEKISERVGRENIMIKIHPRNPENRFSKLGYKTNINTSIPWEVVIMNMDDISEKILLTISSSSILNPILIFGKTIRAYSLYNCIDHENCHSRLLSGEMWDAALKLFQKHSDMITVCETIDDVK